uniref:Copper transport protein n=1 Tax=Steinernema glaseri TaxID=37863 RepID=A0A1I7Y0S2_9BILA
MTDSKKRDLLEGGNCTKNMRSNQDLFVIPDLANIFVFFHACSCFAGARLQPSTMMDGLKELLSTLSSTPTAASTTLPPCSPDLPVYMQCKTMLTQSIHFTEREIVIFKFWKTGSLAGMAVSVLIVFLLCLLHEAIKGLRLFLAKAHFDNIHETQVRQVQAGRTASFTSNDTLLFAPLLKAASSAFTVYRISQAALYGLQMTLAYALVLVIMTFNGALVIAVIVGEAVGYFVFIGSPSFEEGAGC